ncbi:MAG: hypothetical protein AB8F94_20365 [Saprospiraceae bacterium]
MNIQYLKAEEIDKNKWNSCVHFANNGNPFGYMWYLNNVSKNWDCLIEDDYESVLPLIWKPKILNTKELYIPHWVRSSGIYSVNILSKKRVDAFLNAIPPEYQNIEMALNEEVNFQDDLNFEKTEHQNYHILLNKDYPSIANDYSKETIDIISAAESSTIFSIANLKPETLADFYKKHTKDNKWVEEKFHALQRIMYNAMHRGLGFSTGVEDKKGNLLAADFFIFSHGKLISLIGTISEEGKKTGAHHMLIDRIIQTNATRPVILDFNQNEKWTEGFGAKPTLYLHIKRKTGWRKFL